MTFIQHKITAVQITVKTKVLTMETIYKQHLIIADIDHSENHYIDHGKKLHTAQDHSSQGSQ